jgi:NADPH-dependent ferric siderophore reductase
MTAIERAVRRVRHDMKLRLLQVRAVERVTPACVRISLGGEDLAGYATAGYDDHSKLFFPAPGAGRPELPETGVYPEGATQPSMRDYTPRRYDAAKGVLVFDISLHGEGPAAEWAAAAQVGQYLGVGGPRGSFVVEGDFDWYLLIGDESALPAIARRLEELPAQARVLAVIEVANAAEQQNLVAPADTRIVWLHRDARQNLLAALPGLEFPAGEAYAFVACEGDVAKEIRQYLITQRGLNKKWLKASGYWSKGAAAVHEHFDE